MHLFIESIQFALLVEDFILQAHLEAKLLLSLCLREELFF